MRLQIDCLSLLLHTQDHVKTKARQMLLDDLCFLTNTPTLFQGTQIGYNANNSLALTNKNGPSRQDGPFYVLNVVINWTFFLQP